jgi:hypothetical protein
MLGKYRTATYLILRADFSPLLTSPRPSCQKKVQKGFDIAAFCENGELEHLQVLVIDRVLICGRKIAVLNGFKQ